MRRDSVFVGLKDTIQVSAQWVILSRSMFRHSAADRGCSTIIQRLVSSANSRILEPISVMMSFMYKRKSKGPKIYPCGTPAFMEAQSEVTPGRTTRCFLSKI